MKIGYLASAYPAVSHTFIRREIAALRARGIDIDTFSLRRTPDAQILSEEDRIERDRTFSILPLSLPKALFGQIKGFLRSPIRYVRTLRLALKHRMPGARSAVWATFHFAEAVLLALELERRRISHLHSHFSNAGGDVGFLATRYLGLPWSLTLHGSADFDAPTRLLLGQKIAATEFTACVSYFGRALAHRLSAPEDWHKLFVARCGVDVERISSNAARASRKEKGRLRVVTVGRLAPEKGFIGLVEAFANAVGAGLDAELRIVGSGPQEDDILARSRALGIGDRVTLPGHANEEGVAQELSQADLFVMSSFMEGLPVVIMEAMTLKVPVVAPCLAGIPELVEHNVSGLLFNPADWEQLGERMVDLLGDPERRRRFGEEGYQRILAQFEITRAVEPLERHFLGFRTPFVEVAYPVQLEDKIGP